MESVQFSGVLYIHKVARLSPSSSSKHFHLLKRKLLSIERSLPSPRSWPRLLASTGSFLSLWIYLVWVLRVNGIISRDLLCLALLPSRPVDEVRPRWGRCCASVRYGVQCYSVAQVHSTGGDAVFPVQQMPTLGLLPLFSLMNGAAVSICIQVLVRVSVFIAFRYILRSRIAGSYGNSQCRFLRNFQTFLHGCTFYILTSSI